jgi:Zn-dependent membrane protease YugP
MMDAGMQNGVSPMAVYWIIFIGIAVVSWLVQNNLKSKFEKYSKLRSYGGLTGREVAEKMLRDNGIMDVRVVSTSGRLTDHYNPVDKTVNLSQGVYESNSIMAAAVAAHECGHAVQHALAYGPLKLRSQLVPIVNFASQWMQWLLLIGMLVLSNTGDPTTLAIGVVLFATTTVFAFVTLPVEIDASRRAIAWLDNACMTDRVTHDAAVDSLRSAAYTYVVAALSSLATLLYYVWLLVGSRSRD